MKSLVLGLMLVCVVLNTYGLGTNQVQTWGAHKYNDNRAHYQLLNKSGSIFSFGQKQKEYKFPPKGGYNYRNITLIQVTDQLNDKDCRAVITDGGVGYRHVTMQFQGSGRKGYNFIWEVYVA